MTAGLGYTHSMFTGNLRSCAEYVDKKENGGNNNGLIDGNEINAFLQRVKKKYSFDFSFNNIKQSEKRTISVRKNDGSWKYGTTSEIARAYANNGLSSKTIDALNGKTAGKDILSGQRQTVDIAYMNSDDFKKAQEIVQKQEDAIRQKLDADEQKKKEAENARNKEPDFWKHPIDWIKWRYLTH